MTGWPRVRRRNIRTDCKNNSITPPRGGKMAEMKEEKEKKEIVGRFIIIITIYSSPSHHGRAVIVAGCKTSYCMRAALSTPCVFLICEFPHPFKNCRPVPAYRTPTPPVAVYTATKRPFAASPLRPPPGPSPLPHPIAPPPSPPQHAERGRRPKYTITLLLLYIYA